MLCLSQRDKISSIFLFIFPHSSYGIIRYCLVLIWVFVPKTIRRPFRFCLLKIVLYRSTSRSHSSIAFISTLSYTVAIHDVDFNVFSKTGLWLIISEEFVYVTTAISPSQMSSFLHVWTRTVTSHFRRRLCRISEIFLKQFSEKKEEIFLQWRWQNNNLDQVETKGCWTAFYQYRRCKTVWINSVVTGMLKRSRRQDENKEACM